MNEIYFNWGKHRWSWIDDKGREYSGIDVTFILIKVINAIIRILNKKLCNNSDMTILINDGEIFEGSISQFRDCFFDNANLETIEDWAKKQGFNFKIKT